MKRTQSAASSTLSTATSPSIDNQSNYNDLWAKLLNIFLYGCDGLYLGQTGMTYARNNEIAENWGDFIDSPIAFAVGLVETTLITSIAIWTFRNKGTVDETAIDRLRMQNFLYWREVLSVIKNGWRAVANAINLVKAYGIVISRAVIISILNPIGIMTGLALFAVTIWRKHENSRREKLFAPSKWDADDLLSYFQQLKTEYQTADTGLRQQMLMAATILDGTIDGLYLVGSLVMFASLFTLNLLTAGAPLIAMTALYAVYTGFSLMSKWWEERQRQQHYEAHRQLLKIAENYSEYCQLIKFYELACVGKESAAAGFPVNLAEKLIKANKLGLDFRNHFSTGWPEVYNQIRDKFSRLKNGVNAVFCVAGFAFGQAAFYTGRALGVLITAAVVGLSCLTISLWQWANQAQVIQKHTSSVEESQSLLATSTPGFELTIAPPSDHESTPGYELILFSGDSRSTSSESPAAEDDAEDDMLLAKTWPLAKKDSVAQKFLPKVGIFSESTMRYRDLVGDKNAKKFLTSKKESSSVPFSNHYWSSVSPE